MILLFFRSTFSQLNPRISPRLIPVDKAKVTMVNKWILWLDLQTTKSISLSSSLRNLVLPWASLGLLIWITGLTAIHCHSLMAIVQAWLRRARYRLTVAGVLVLPVLLLSSLVNLSLRLAISEGVRSFNLWSPSWTFHQSSWPSWFLSLLSGRTSDLYLFNRSVRVYFSDSISLSGKYLLCLTLVSVSWAQVTASAFFRKVAVLGLCPLSLTNAL